VEGGLGRWTCFECKGGRALSVEGGREGRRALSVEEFRAR
jgi:hypothetical protein